MGKDTREAFVIWSYGVCFDWRHRQAKHYFSEMSVFPFQDIKGHKEYGIKLNIPCFFMLAWTGLSASFKKKKAALCSTHKLQKWQQSPQGPLNKRLSGMWPNPLTEDIAKAIDKEHWMCPFEHNFHDSWADQSCEFQSHTTNISIL